MEEDVRQGSASPLSEWEYQKNYGKFWLISDNMQKISEGHGPDEFKLLTKPDDFRQSHRTVKDLLFNTTDLEQLSRKVVFPMYIRELQIKNIDLELAKRD